MVDLLKSGMLKFYMQLIIIINKYGEFTILIKYECSNQDLHRGVKDRKGVNI